MSYNKLFPMQMAKRVYVFIFLMVLVPSLLFAVVTTVSTVRLKAEEKKKDLYRAAVFLERQLPGSFRESLARGKDENMGREEAILALNRILQPVMTETVQLFPEFTLGYYSEKLDCTVAFGSGMGPGVLLGNQDQGGFFHPGELVDPLLPSPLWREGAFLSIHYPIQEEGGTAGYVWTRFYTQDIYRQAWWNGLLIFGSGIPLSLATLAFFWATFNRFRHDLEIFSRSLFRSKGKLSKVSIPELRPILEEARRYQQASNMETISQFAANVVHEIKNPLTTMRGFSQLLLDKESDPTKRAYMDFIIKEVDRLNGFVTNFLHLTKSNKTRLEEVGVEGLLQEVETLVGGSCLKANVRLRIKVVQAGLTMLCDPNHLRQVLLNLILNALQALDGREGGEITVRAYGVGPKVYVEVADNGPGIPVRQLGKIFEPFYSTKSTGTGLGLTVSRHLMEQVGGSLDVSSQAGEGTTFTAVLWRDKAALAGLGKAGMTSLGFSK